MSGFSRSAMLKTVAPLLIVLGVIASPADTLAQERGQVRFGHNRAWGNAAVVIALQQGYFKRAGINVVERSFDNPADIVQAIAAGDLDAGVSSAGVLFTAVERGVKVKAVGVSQGAQNPENSYKVRTDSGINRVADLRGKTAGIAGFGGNTDLLLRYWLQKAGLDPKTDLKIVFVPFQLTMPALINRQIDVAVVGSVQAGGADKQYPGQLKTLFSYTDVLKEAIGNGNMNNLLLVFGTDFIERDRETGRRFLEGHLAAIKAIHADPKKAINDWAEAAKIDAIRVLEKPVTLPSDGKVYLDELQFEAGLALKFGYIKRPVDMRMAVDHSLVEEAAARLK